MRTFLIATFCLLILPQIASAATAVAAAQNYFMIYYQDSYYNDASYAVSDLSIPSFITLSYKIKNLTKTRSFYTDSLGNRFNCIEKKTYTKCSYKENYVDSGDGTNCIAKYDYYFTVRKKNRIDAIFSEWYQCDDGWYRNIQYGGRTPYKVKR